jgi:molecular chaperone DnaK (HSP70)
LASADQQRFHIKNVNSHSLGVVGTESATRRQRSAILIPRNTPLPITATRVFKTQKAHQRSILVPVVEGESPDPGQCVPIGDVVVARLPSGLPAHAPIDIRFTYEGNGRLQVNVSVGSDEALEHVLERPNSLTREELNKWRVYVSGQPAVE